MLLLRRSYFFFFNDTATTEIYTPSLHDALPIWFKRSEDIIGDHKEFGDAGIVDMLLHAQDRPFTVDELYDLVEGCCLHVIEMIERGRSKYKVEAYIRDRQIHDRVSALPRRQQQTL